MDVSRLSKLNLDDFSIVADHILIYFTEFFQSCNDVLTYVFDEYFIESGAELQNIYEITITFYPEFNDCNNLVHFMTVSN